MMVLSALAELSSFGAVLPFLEAINSEPDVHQNGIYKLTYDALPFIEPNNVTAFFTVFFIVLVIFSSLVRLKTLRMSGKFAASLGSEMSTLAFKNTLYQQYQVHLSRNTAEIINTIAIQSNRCVLGVYAILNMITSMFVALAIFLALFLVDWQVSLFITLAFSSLYLLIASNFKHTLKKNSSLIEKYSRLSLKDLQEGLRGVRNVILGGLQPYYIDSFSEFDLKQRNYEANSQFLAGSPRFILESAGMIILAIIGFTFIHYSNSNPLAILGVFALGAQKLLPSLQLVYSGWAQVNAFKSDFISMYNLLNQPISPTFLSASTKFKFITSVEFKDVSFKYASAKVNVIDKLNIKINAGDIVGIVGKSGGGKSTFSDLFAGLISPTSGKIYVDGIDLNEPTNSSKLQSWRESISYIPQDIFVTDSTIIENIAIGLDKSTIDFKKVRECCKIACIDEYIVSLPSKYDTLVGESGSRLSGGQKQRIGIARALYRSTPCYIFDESTSALDYETEMKIINNLKENVLGATILMIAHRLSSLKFCNRIIEFTDGTFKDVDCPIRLN